MLPHRAFNRPCGGVAVFSVGFGVVHYFDIAFHHKIDELANGHTGVNTHGLRAGYFQRPGIAKAYVAFAGGGVYIDTQSAGARFSFPEGYMAVQIGRASCRERV